MKATRTLDAINSALEQEQEREHRSHLGASILAKKCLREIWYSWHWVSKELFEGQMLRLFERGQLEESRFVEYLRKIGCEVWETDPTTGNQWRVSFANGHGGGSGDGVARGIPDLPPGTPFLIECKTHNDKYFKQLEAEGLCQAKPEHFGQAQIYMVLLELPAALYMAVNKNTDDLYLELLKPNPGYVATLLDRANQIVEAKTAPPKINKSPSFYLCRFCHFVEICHNKAPVEENCRTCLFSKPLPGGVWGCGKYGVELTKEQQAAGCHDYRTNPVFHE